MELLGKVRDRSVGTSQLLENAASRGIRERGERSIEAVRRLNHMVQYSAYGGGMQGAFSTAVVLPQTWAWGWANVAKASPSQDAKRRIVAEATGLARESAARKRKLMLSFDQAALDAVRQWGFTPSTLNGAPVRVVMSVVVSFTVR